MNFATSAALLVAPPLTSTNPPSRFAVSTIVSAIALGVVLVLGWGGYSVYFKSPMLEVGDIAVNALQIDHAKHFAELYGNYSRFEFNHPGPVFFYVYAAAEYVLYDWLHVVPSPGNAHLLAGMALQSVFFAIALAVLASQQRARLFVPLALLVGAAYFGPLRQPFVSIWPPHVLLMPFLCLLATATTVAAGRLAHLPLLLLSAGFLIHGHVAQAMCAPLLGGMGVLLGVRQAWLVAERPAWRVFVRERRRLLAGSAAIVLAFSLPLLIDLILLGSRGNVATIIGRFIANGSDSKSLLQSLLYFVSFGTTLSDQHLLFTKLGPEAFAFLSANTLRLSLWAIALFAPPTAAWVMRARLTADERRLLASGYALLVAAIGVSLLWGMAQAGDMAQFNGYFYYAIYYYALLLPLLMVARLLAPLEQVRRLAPLGAVALCLAAVVIGGRYFQQPSRDSDEGLPIAAAVDSLLHSSSAPRPKFLVFEHAMWPTVAAVGLELQRRGVPFFASPWWGFMFGQRHELVDSGPGALDGCDIWWIGKPGPDGIPLTPELSLFPQPAPLQPDGGEIHFQGGGNGFRYHIYGLGPGFSEHAWSDLPRVLVEFAPQPASGDVRVTFDAISQIRDATGLVSWPADIFYNGQLLGRVAVADRGQVAVTIPQTAWNAHATGRLEIRFLETRTRRALKRPRYESFEAWGLWSIRFDRAP